MSVKQWTRLKSCTVDRVYGLAKTENIGNSAKIAPDRLKMGFISRSYECDETF